jgi:carbamate kinase
MRLSIEVSSEQHQRLKAAAALCGQSIKDYVLDRVLPDRDDEALQQLDKFLGPRLKESSTNKTVQQIFEDTHQEMQ